MTIDNAGVAVQVKRPTSAVQQSAQHAIGFWKAVAGHDFSLFLIVCVWLWVTLPQALFHGYHYVEGLTVTLAQSAMDDGNWLTPHLYNFRWIERPTLLSWVIAAISLPFGHVSPFIARLPIVLSLLAGLLLVWRTLRPVASAEAAIFGAAVFLACPLVMRYYVTSVADLPLAVLLFSAFLLWWRAYAAARFSFNRWLGIGCVLAIAALLKGPQPIAYFMLGVLIFVIFTSTWRQIPGLILAGILAVGPCALWYAHVFLPGDQGEWMRYTRLSSEGFAWPHPFANAVDFFFETFPASLLAAALLLTGTQIARKTVPSKFVLALSCYAFACTFVVLFWPSVVNPRYVLPTVLPLSVLAGIAYDALFERRPVLVAGCIFVVVGLLGYATVHSANDVLFKPAYFLTKISGKQIVEMVASSPAPIYRTMWDAGMNELAYVNRRVITIAPADIMSVARPAWVVVPAAQRDAILARGAGHVNSRLVLDRAVLLRVE